MHKPKVVTRECPRLFRNNRRTLPLVLVICELVELLLVELRCHKAQTQEMEWAGVNILITNPNFASWNTLSDKYFG